MDESRQAVDKGYSSSRYLRCMYAKSPDTKPKRVNAVCSQVIEQFLKFKDGASGYPA